MKVLGLDLGNRTLGMAVSDFLGIIANPIGTMRFDDCDLNKALEYTIEAVKEHGVQKIVLGLPKNMNGTIGPQAEYCLKFKEMVEEATKLEVVMIDGKRCQHMRIKYRMVQVLLAGKKSRNYRLRYRAIVE